jgi:maltooligosyltrehalose trehalohydrolase
MTWQLPIGAQVTETGTRFRVWAPTAAQVEVVLFHGDSASARHLLAREAHGYWSAHLESIDAGARYAFSVDGGDLRPDPASRSQPDGVHAPSEVVDPLAFRWTDDAWRGVPLDDMVIYELHVGTAMPAGTFDALIEKLPYFCELGVTALELMPVAAFPGRRNWGYDGVDLYAPAPCYGGPTAMKRLVDAAHAHGLAVLLDVVYNHFGPDGNYLRTFSPYYFSDLHRTPWGEALNLDGPNSGAVRDFLINNALYWAHEYHIDGLRLDATHALIDGGTQHLLQQMTVAVRASLPNDRRFVITAEDERNDARLLQPAEQDGYGLDAVWSDDFHHQARVALTGEQHGYFGYYTGSVADLAQTIRDGWFEQGLRSNRHGHAQAHGTGPQAFGYEQFVFCIQNHDQVGNRPVGERLHHAVDGAAYRALSALLLLLPETPLLFGGQEWAASTPFLFFTDHPPALGKLVTEGRRREFAYFLTETGIVVPDPQAEATFERSKLRWDELEQPAHAATLALYRDLLRLRRTQGALRRLDRAGMQVTPLGEHAFVLRRDGSASHDTLLAIVNLGATAADLSINPPASAAYTVLLDTNAAQYGGTAPAQLAQGNGDTLRVQMHTAGVVVVQRLSD